MPHDVAQVPPRAERKLLPRLRFFDGEIFHLLRRVRTKRVRRRAAQHALYRKKADERERKQNSNHHYDAEKRHVQLPIGQIHIRAHHARRIHNDIRDSVAERDTQRRADDADGERIRGIMRENPLVFIAERFQRADLRFFLRRDTVHGSNHGKHRDGKEQHGQHRAHRLPFFDFAVR